jgi:hypothetical protein
LPSLFAVTADVFLADEATNRLRSVQSAYYRPEVTFHHWNPRKWLNLYSTKRSEAIASEAVTTWIGGLRHRIEVLLRPYVSGHFLDTPNKENSRLPAIETYRLINVPLGLDSDRSKPRPTGWWSSLGFDPSGLRSYESTDKLLSWTESGFCRFARLCLAKPPEAEPFIEYVDTGLLNDMLSAFAILVLIDSQEVNLVRLRRGAYRRLIFGVRFRGLHRDIRDVQELTRRSLVMKRLEVEFEGAKDLITRQMKHLSDMVNSANPNRPPMGLDSALMKGIDWKTKLVEQHVTLLKEAFAEHVSVLNIRLMYRLQLAIFWLILVYTILTFLAVVVVWPQLDQMWEKVHALNGTH